MIISVEDSESTLKHFDSFQDALRLKVKVLGGLVKAAESRRLQSRTLSRLCHGETLRSRYSTLKRYAKALGVESFEVSGSKRLDTLKLEGIIRQMIRHESLNREDIPFVSMVLIEKLQTLTKGVNYE